MTDSLESRVAQALSKVTNPRHGNDVLSAGMVRDLAVDPSGAVTLTFLLGRQDPATLVREVRRALSAVQGVSDVKIDVVEPSRTPAPPGSRAPEPTPTFLEAARPSNSLPPGPARGAGQRRTPRNRRWRTRRGPRPAACRCSQEIRSAHKFTGGSAF